VSCFDAVEKSPQKKQPFFVHHRQSAILVLAILDNPDDFLIGARSMAFLTMNTVATVDAAEILFLEWRCIMTTMVVTQRRRKGTRSQQVLRSRGCP